MKERTYNLRELCREADVTERTVRYYIKEGLLPPPHGSGPFSRYGYEHWLRLQFIKRLKDEYLPLSEIKNLLDSRSTAELDQLARQNGLIPASNGTSRGPDAPVPPDPSGGKSAAEQPSGALQNLMGGGGSGRSRMLREQMAPDPPPLAGGASYGSVSASAQAPAPGQAAMPAPVPPPAVIPMPVPVPEQAKRARSVAESAPEFYAPSAESFAAMPGPNADFAVETFADYPLAAEMMPDEGEFEGLTVNEAILADDEGDWEAEDLASAQLPLHETSFDVPPQRSTYGAPPPTFLAGSAGPPQSQVSGYAPGASRSVAPRAPGSASAQMPGQGLLAKPEASGLMSRFNHSVRASAPASPQRAMRMSRFAASENAGSEAIQNEAFSDAATSNQVDSNTVANSVPNDLTLRDSLAGGLAGNEIVEETPYMPDTSEMIVSKSVAPAPMLAKMAPASMAAPVQAPMPAPAPLAQPPGSAGEIVTGQTWVRIEVAPGVELHIEKRIADTHRPALANLLQAARRLFGPKEI